MLKTENHSNCLRGIKAGEVNAMTLALTVLFAVNLYARAGRSR
jgi:hypothetical protein